MRDSGRGGTVLLVMMAAIAGCDGPPTGIRLHVYSDLGSNLSGVHVRVTPSLDDGGVVAPFDGGVPVGLDDSYPVRPPGSPIDDPRAPIPLDIGIAPFDGLGPIGNRSIVMDVDAEGAPCALHIRRMRRFEAGRIMHVYAELTEDCCDVVCPAEYSCGFGGYCTPDDPTVARECSTAAPEWCDGLDNDCDPNVDEGDRSCGDGVCTNTVALCVDGRFNPCAPLPPDFSMCGTGADADCDGAVTEGTRLTSFADRDGDGYGDRRAEVYGCAERPSGSVADATDCDDFNASVHPGATESCGIGPCRRTVETCVGGVRQSCVPGTPAAESCNNVDDDCDGAIDDGVTRTCSTACGSGTERCASGAWFGCTARLPTSESCNNVDDDCDGAIDDGLSRSCTGSCGTGVQTCSGGSWGACSATPGPERCNGVDDDCDGTIDDFPDSDQFCPTGGFCSGPSAAAQNAIHGCCQPGFGGGCMFSSCVSGYRLVSLPGCTNACCER